MKSGAAIRMCHCREASQFAISRSPPRTSFLDKRVSFMRILPIATIASAIAAFAVPAVAQTAPTFSASAGYTHINALDVGLGAATLRGGARFGRYFGLEAEMSFGVIDDTLVGPPDVDVGVDHQYAVYAVAALPVSPEAELFLRAGYGETEISGTSGGSTAAAAGRGWNYGVGGQWFRGANGVRADYTRMDLNAGTGGANAFSLSFVRRF